MYVCSLKFNKLSYVLSCFDGHKCVHNRGFPLFGWIYFALFLFPFYLICSHFVTNTYHHVANTPLSILRYAVFKTSFKHTIYRSSDSWILKWLRSPRFWRWWSRGRWSGMAVRSSPLRSEAMWRLDASPPRPWWNTPRLVRFFRPRTGMP